MATPSKSRGAGSSASALNQRLVEATLQLLREEIPTDLTVRRIAAAAGTTTMALYTGFGSRDGLLDVVYAQGFEQLYEQMAPSAQLTDPAEALVALLDA
jgi:AcrR family transcriptional regulator